MVVACSNMSERTYENDKHLSQNATNNEFRKNQSPGSDVKTEDTDASELRHTAHYEPFYYHAVSRCTPQCRFTDAHMKSDAFAGSIFTKLTRAQQHPVKIYTTSAQIPPGCLVAWRHNFVGGSHIFGKFLDIPLYRISPRWVSKVESTDTNLFYLFISTSQSRDLKIVHNELHPTWSLSMQSTGRSFFTSLRMTSLSRVSRNSRSLDFLVKNFYTEFHENPAHGLVTSPGSCMDRLTSSLPKTFFLLRKERL